MFTGIIEQTATVLSIDAGSIVLTRPATFDDLTIGCSIAVSGTCLSVTAFDQETMSFDLAETTVHKTTLGSMHKGTIVNLERPLAANGRFDGHVVQGHVEATGVVTALPEEANSFQLSVRVPDHLLPFIVHHGSITIDGVSLTVADLQGDIMTVALIPLTLSSTAFSRLLIDDRVNIETDILAKYLLRHATR